MDRHEPREDRTDRVKDEADAIRVARVQRDLDLSPSQRLDKLAALCQQADLLRNAQRLP